MSNKTLDVYGADGVLTNVDIMGAIEKGNPKELHQYFIRAAQFIANETGLTLEKVYNGIKTEIRDEVFPNRDKVGYWHEFGQGMKIAPAVDHMLITPFATKLFLHEVLAELDANGPTAHKVREFLGKKGWEEAQYQFASTRFEQDAVMEPDAIDALDYKLGQDHSIAIATNSGAGKIHTLLRKGGFKEDRIIENDVQPGKIGVFDDVGKYKVDRRAPYTPKSSLNLRPFGVETSLDLRRTHYRDKLLEMVNKAGATEMEIVESIPELMVALPYLFGEDVIGEQVNLSVRRTPNITDSGLALAGHMKARVQKKLGDLINL